MKILITADTHLGLQKNSIFWLNEAKKYFYHIFDFCKANNIKNIIHAGDFFHERKNINTRTIQYAINIAKRSKGLNIHICPGNHDIYSKYDLKPTSLSMFDAFKNINIIYKPKTIGNSLLVPWNVDMNKLNPSKILIGHFPIKGFSMNDYTTCMTDDYTPEMFIDSYELVFSGHFHHRSIKSIGGTDFIYIGSPYQQDFGDCDETRGFYIFDDEKCEYEFIEYIDAPKFIKIIATNDEIKEKIKNNIVKLIYLTDYGTITNNKILEKVQKMNPAFLYTDFSNLALKDNQNTLDIDQIQIKNNIEILYDYLDNVVNIPEFLNIKSLKLILNSIIKEVDDG